MHIQNLSQYDKGKYKEMILDAAETVLWFLGFDRTVYSNNIKKKKGTRKGYDELREELNRHIADINLHKINVKEDEDIVTANTSNNPFGCQDYNNNKLSASLLKLKIRNTTAYLNWRIEILKRDNFKCRMRSASVKENKGQD